MNLSPRARLTTWCAVALPVFVLDQFTKDLALRHLTVGVPVHVIGTMQWNLVFNSGMAFSKGRGLGPVIAVAVVAVVVSIAASLRRSTTVVSAVIVGLIIGGALGNLTDRLFRSGSGFLGGHVVDFIDVQFWPVWNVADMAVVVGMLLLAYEWLRHPRTAAVPGDV